MGVGERSNKTNKGQFNGLKASKVFQFSFKCSGGGKNRDIPIRTPMVSEEGFDASLQRIIPSGAV